MKIDKKEMYEILIWDKKRNEKFLSDAISSNEYSKSKKEDLAFTLSIIGVDINTLEGELQMYLTRNKKEYVEICNMEYYEKIKKQINLDLKAEKG